MFARMCVVAAVLAAVSGRVPAATKLWNVGQGDWSTPRNWQLPGVPAAEDEVKIPRKSSNCIISANSSVAAQRIYVAAPGTSTLTISGTLNVQGERAYLKVGMSRGNGVCLQTGTLNISKEQHGLLVVGDGGPQQNDTTEGRYHLKEGRISADAVFVGARSATGRMIQTGGTMEANEFTIGDTGNGCYELLGGTFTAGQLKIANGELRLGKGANCNVVKQATISSHGTVTVEIGEGPCPRITATGDVRILQGSTLAVEVSPGRQVPAGQELTLIETSAGNAVRGSFTNLPAGWACQLRDDNRKLVLIRQKGGD